MPSLFTFLAAVAMALAWAHWLDLAEEGAPDAEAPLAEPSVVLHVTNEILANDRAQLKRCVTDYDALEQACIFRRTLLPRLTVIGLIMPAADRWISGTNALLVVMPWLLTFAVAAIGIECAWRWRLWNDAVVFRAADRSLRS